MEGKCVHDVAEMVILPTCLRYLVALSQYTGVWVCSVSKPGKITICALHVENQPLIINGPLDIHVCVQEVGFGFLFITS